MVHLLAAAPWHWGSQAKEIIGELKQTNAPTLISDCWFFTFAHMQLGPKNFNLFLDYCWDFAGFCVVSYFILVSIIIFK